MKNYGPFSATFAVVMLHNTTGKSIITDGTASYYSLVQCQWYSHIDWEPFPCWYFQ